MDSLPFLLHEGSSGLGYDESILRVLSVEYIGMRTEIKYHFEPHPAPWREGLGFPPRRRVEAATRHQTFFSTTAASAPGASSCATSPSPACSRLYSTPRTLSSNVPPNSALRHAGILPSNT